MSETDSTSKKLQWKFVNLTLVMYIVFILGPMAAGADMGLAPNFLGVWVFGGIVIIAVLVGFSSGGLLEPAIATAILTIPWIGCFGMITSSGSTQVSSRPLIGALIFWSLSLVGSWLGVRARKQWERQPQVQQLAREQPTLPPTPPVPARTKMIRLFLIFGGIVVFFVILMLLKR